MPRPPRFDQAGFTRHVIQRGANRQDIFRDEQDFQIAQRYLDEALRREDTALHAYVLMGNHFHLLLTPERDGALGRLMQDFGRRYVPYFNARYRHSGGLFQGRYRALVIGDDRYLLACSRYVEMNPVRAGLCQLPAHYGWSSYRANAEGRPTDAPRLTAHPVYAALGGNPESRRSAYRALFAAPLPPDEVQSLRDYTNRDWILGDDGRVDRIAAESGLRPGPRARGGRRPNAGRPRRA